MGRRSGFCASAFHERCQFLTVNGVRAPSRYVICQCDCHDGDDAGRDIVASALAHWNHDTPKSSVLTEVSRYVDATNAIIFASRNDREADPAEKETDVSDE
jgi:hypothetical protein